MRRMSFALTLDAMRERRKTVTRRRADTWRSLKAGDRLLAVSKVMGLKKGERPEVLGVIEVVDVRVEPLDAITDEDIVAEGLTIEGAAPEIRIQVYTPHGFVEMFRRHMGGEPDQLVRRIEFRHVEERDQ